MNRIWKCNEKEENPSVTYGIFNINFKLLINAVTQINLQYARGVKMEWFKTNGILDEHILRGIAKYGISRTEKVATLVYLAGGTVFILLKVHVLAVFYFIVGLFLVLYQMVLFKRITIHDNLKNMQLVNGVSAFQYITWFDEEGIALINLTNHAEGKILYRHFIKVIETEDILAVQTKKWFVPVFKDQLGPGEVEELFAFLKSRNRKIKIRRLKSTAGSKRK